MFYNRLAFSLLLLLTFVGCSSVPQQQHSSAVVDQYQTALHAMKTGQNDQALNLFVKMTRDYPALAGPYANLGLLYQKQGLSKEAGAAFDKAVALQPQSTQIYNAAGIFYRSVGRFDDAEKAYLNAIDKSSGNADAVLNLAILYDLYLNKPAKAINYYKRYLSLTKDKNEKVELWLVDLERRTSM